MKKIINTINERIEVYIKGKTYVLEAKGSIEVPKEVAEYWTNSLHEFLISEDIAPVKKEEVKEIKEMKEVVEIPEVKVKETKTK